MIKPVARGTAIADGIRADIPLSADMRLLDIGAGGGEVSIELAPYVKSILAIDTSEEVLGRLREKIEQDQVLERKFETRCHDLSIEPLSSDSFDLVMASMTLHHVEKTDSLLDNLAAIVRPGGYVAIADLETEDGSFHGTTRAVPHHGFDTQLLAERLTRLGFDVISCREIFQIERGERRYPVFLLTGRKE